MEIRRINAEVKMESYEWGILICMCLLFALGGFVVSKIITEDCPACFCDTSDNVKIVKTACEEPTLEECANMTRMANEVLIKQQYYFRERK